MWVCEHESVWAFLSMCECVIVCKCMWAYLGVRDFMWMCEFLLVCLNVFEYVLPGENVSECIYMVVRVYESVRFYVSIRGSEWMFVNMSECMEGFLNLSESVWL